MLKKILLSLCTLYVFTIVKGQVVIGSTTNTTNLANLDVKSNPLDRSKVDGIIAPRFTKIELINKKSPAGVYSYNESHKGAYVFVTDITLSNNVVDLPETKGIVDKGLYYFNGKAWVGISSDLGKISIYASASSQNAIPNNNGIGVQNFVNQSRPLFLNFSTNDIIYEGVTSLKQETYTMDNNQGTQVSSYFELLEDGLYEVSAYIILNPYRGDLSLDGGSFLVINLFASKSANTKYYTSQANAPENQITGIRSVIIGPNTGIPDIIYIPPTVVNFSKGEKIYLSAVNPPLAISGTGVAVRHDSTNGKNNISRFFAGEELFPFEKYISIRKL